VPSIEAWLYGHSVPAPDLGNQTMIHKTTRFALSDFRVFSNFGFFDFAFPMFDSPSRKNESSRAAPVGVDGAIFDWGLLPQNAVSFFGLGSRDATGRGFSR
jgi:hypothetical protein